MMRPKKSLLMFRLAADKAGAESTTITEEHPTVCLIIIAASQVTGIGEQLEA